MIKAYQTWCIWHVLICFLLGCHTEKVWQFLFFQDARISWKNSNRYDKLWQNTLSGNDIIYLCLSISGKSSRYVILYATEADKKFVSMSENKYSRLKRIKDEDTELSFCWFVKRHDGSLTLCVFSVSPLLWFRRKDTLMFLQAKWLCIATKYP